MSKEGDVPSWADVVQSVTHYSLLVASMSQYINLPAWKFGVRLIYIPCKNTISWATNWLSQDKFKRKFAF